MSRIEQVLTSLEVAQMVGKDHSKLLRDIRNYVSQLGEAKIGFTDFFTESSYVTEQNKTMPCYLITKKGCEFIAHKLTGKKATEFTATYINRFHEMENVLETQTAPAAIQQFMERQQSFMEELVKMNRSMSDKLAALESKSREPLGIAVNPGAKPFMVAENENATRKKNLNRLVAQMAKACGWTKSFALHRLYKTLEEVLDISIDDFVELYREEIQEDVCHV